MLNLNASPQPLYPLPSVYVSAHGLVRFAAKPFGLADLTSHAASKQVPHATQAAAKQVLAPSGAANFAAEAAGRRQQEQQGTLGEHKDSSTKKDERKHERTHQQHVNDTAPGGRHLASCHTNSRACLQGGSQQREQGDDADRKSVV